MDGFATSTPAAREGAGPRRQDDPARFFHPHGCRTATNALLMIGGCEHGSWASFTPRSDEIRVV